MHLGSLQQLELLELDELVDEDELYSSEEVELSLWSELLELPKQSNSAVAGEATRVPSQTTEPDRPLEFLSERVIEPAALVCPSATRFR